MRNQKNKTERKKERQNPNSHCLPLFLLHAFPKSLGLKLPSILSRPDSQLGGQFTVTEAAFTTHRGHDQNVSFRRALNAQVRIVRAKLEVLVVGHPAFPLDGHRPL